MRKYALINKLYRYELGRIWDESKPPLVFVMLNPSTADADKDDPTVRRCIGFARREGAGGVVVVNRFAYRTAKPAELRAALRKYGVDYVTGGEANLEVLQNATVGRRVVCAWGAHLEAYRGTQLLARDVVHYCCLGRTKTGHPRHPLYVRSDAPLVPM